MINRLLNSINRNRSAAKIPKVMSSTAHSGGEVQSANAIFGKTHFFLDTLYYFPKMRGGSKAVWNFSKNSSNLVAPPFPYRKLADLTKCVDFFTYFFASPHCVDEIKAEMLMSFLFSFLHQMVIKEDT